MYVCVCFGVTDAEIDEAIDAGHRCPDKIALRTGASSGCGMCRETVCERLATRLKNDVTDPPGAGALEVERNAVPV